MNTGSAFVVKDGKRVFTGVGVAANIKNAALKRATAGNRARAEVTKLFETFTASSMKDYMSTVSDSVSEQQHIGAAIKGFSSQTLSGVEVKDYFEDPVSHALYARAELDTDAFVAAAAQLKELPQSIRHYVTKGAANTFDAVRGEQDAELKKPGICRHRIRIVQLVPSHENCAIELATELPLVTFPCAGGDTTVLFGVTPMSGRVGAAGSIHLEGTGVGRKEGACSYNVSSAIMGQLKGEISFTYAQQPAGEGCPPPCSGEARVATD